MLDKQQAQNISSRSTINASVTPKGSLEILSQLEVEMLKEVGENGLYALFRQCALAILNTGSDSDNAKTIMEAYPDFHIEIVQQERGIRLNLFNAPANAFVDGEMIASSREMLFSAMRDIVYSEAERLRKQSDLSVGVGITDYVFHLLRNANIFRSGEHPNMVVCWGGHSISDIEYKYTKDVGHSLGLRGLDICTGCGPGAMKGPMKGATIAHAKQKISESRFLGLTEPGIIAAEAPNPIVNELVIMPDIEKRLESFVRVAHGIVIFPGGAGTAEELLYLLGILLDPENREIPFPLVLTGPKSSEAYFQQLHNFINKTLGFEAQQKYKIIIDDPEEVARTMIQGTKDILNFRQKANDAFYFNWSLKIQEDFQRPFEPTHKNMASLELSRSLPTHKLAANLRRIFSGIVAGNVKDSGIRAIEKFGVYKIDGEKEIMQPLDNLLNAFVDQQRMKLPGETYIPCYELKNN
ncbi:nucleotide 5'-monophosphate nucleosidase PpnN [Aliikangiella sp. G2MR2-5]|uniref:nucleotide 5'-monophosphate nucleosidase PpnN n=1 Tax=Aliikangiella sp. G2MR2-5 TaxID=2788943 RepID=UPI001AEE6EF8|nr:nucleotide 5'-monophosphate nucleosidase PpnN [Aliikangiella sp. G2MR2-5]